MANILHRRALKYIIELNQSVVRFREEYASLLLRKMLTPFPTAYVDLQSPAGLGTDFLAFNYDGHIFASDEARMLAEMGDNAFRLGHLASDTFEDVLSSDKLIGVPHCHHDGKHAHVRGLWSPALLWKRPSSPLRDTGRCRRSKADDRLTARKNMEVIKHLISLLEDDDNAASVLHSWIT